MSIDTNLAESIYAFPVSPSASFLQAIQSLQDEIAALKDARERDGQELAALRLKLGSLEKDRDNLSENQLIQLRLIHGLKDKRREPTYAEASRAEEIERYLSSRTDHRATYTTLRGHLGIGKDLLNDAIKTLLAASPGKFKIVRAPGDRRKRALVMLAK